MKNIFIAVLGLALSVHYSFSQSLLLDQSLHESDTIYKHTIGGYFSFNLNSNAVSNGLVLSAYAGKKIDQKRKDNEFSRLNRRNTFGFNLMTGLDYLLRTNKPGLALYFAVESRSFSEAVFNEDFAQLLLNGNQPYAGQWKSVSGFHFNQQYFESFRVGIYKIFEDQNFTLGGNLNLYKGGVHQYVNIDHGRIYTEVDGEEITVELDMEFGNQSFNGAPIRTWNGSGAGLDFTVSKELSNHRLTLSGKDIGFISWKDVSSYNANGTYNFDGVEFNNLFRTDSTNFENVEGDQTIQEILDLQEKKKTRTTFLPSIFKLSYKGDSIVGKVGLEVSVQQIISRVYIPKSTVKIIYPVNRNINLLGTISYGGFGYANYGLGVSGYLIKQKLIYKAEIYYLEPLVAPDETSGQGAHFGLAYRF